MVDLPSTKKGAAEVAKLTTGIASAIAGVFLPGASLIGPVANFAIEKYLKRPEKMLLDELKRGNIEILDEERAAAFIPMAYKFFEAAKEGEYEHNLKILAAFLKNEMKLDEPDPSGFARMARRIEGLSLREIKVIALINSSQLTIVQISPAAAQSERPFVSAHQLSRDPSNQEKFDHFSLQETLTELAGRGLLIADGATRLSKAEEYYYVSSSFTELVTKAEGTIVA